MCVFWGGGGEEWVMEVHDVKLQSVHWHLCLVANKFKGFSFLGLIYDE